MKKQTKKYAIIGVVAVIAITLVTMSFTGVLSALFGGNNLITAKFFDPSGYEIKNWVPFSIVKTTSGTTLAENVASMAFTITVKNTGQLPLTVTLETLTPAVFSSSFTNSQQTINPGATALWTSSLITTSQFEGTSPTFYAKVKGTYIYGGQTKTLYKEGSVSYTIVSDPVVGMDLTLGSSVGDTGIGTTPVNGSTTLKTTGTTCTIGSECVSGICNSQYGIAGILNPSGTNMELSCIGSVWVVSNYGTGTTPFVCSSINGCQAYCGCGTFAISYNVATTSCTCGASCSAYTVNNVIKTCA